MNVVPRTTRISHHCGYEQERDRRPLEQMWEPPRGQYGTNVAITTCPNYTTSLPEVLEVMRARQHWEKGQLQMFCDGEQPTDAMQLAVEILDGEASRCEAWLMAPAKEGGGRE